MRPHAFVARGVGVALVVGVALSAGLIGCSADDGDAEPAEGPTTTAGVADPADVAVGADPSAPTGTTDTSDTLSGPVTAESLPAVPEVGIPGLDSDDVVCRAWSRFGGSFQVVAVAASFGADDPDAVAALEVIASPTVTAAYDDLVANWPDELAGEAEIAANGYLGPFARRADRAFAALEAAGADALAQETIGAAWESALAGLDPDEPEIVVALPSDIQAIVDIAASEFAAGIDPIPDDDSLVTDVDVPLTEQYFVDNCPDRGTLGGVEG